MTQTEEFPDASAPYVMLASMDEGLKTLELNMASATLGPMGMEILSRESPMWFTFSMLLMARN